MREFTIMNGNSSQSVVAPHTGSASCNQYRAKREIWISWLAGEDVHAIWRQIASLLSDYAFFQTLNDLRKEANQHPVAGVGFNWQVLRLLDAGFVAMQA